MISRRKRRYNYRGSIFKAQPKRYRYNAPINFKLIRLLMIILAVLIIFMKIRSKNKDDTYTQAQEKIVAFEVAPEVSMGIFEEGKNNKKNIASLFATHILGEEKRLFSSKKTKAAFKDAVDCYKQFILDVEGFPVPIDYEYTFEDSWNAERTYGGTRKHQGTDIMDLQNERGEIPIVSMSQGVIENIGWNDKGGYRIGVRTPNGAYIYYAHLDKYSPKIKKGTKLQTGDLLGYMGDSGYGEEGTVGQFPVHLHIGIATKSFGDNETWINPYYILQYLEEKDMQILKSRGIF